MDKSQDNNYILRNHLKARSFGFKKFNHISLFVADLEEFL